jgi:hypothetical protein
MIRLPRVWRLTVALYALGAGASAVNIFFGSLILSWWGVPVLTPIAALGFGLCLGALPAWLLARHFQRLIARCGE